jgi:hypothetical protein
MTRHARDRLLYRLAQLPQGQQFVLKGATLFAVWGDEFYRPTRDIELLSRGPDDADALTETFRSVCQFGGRDDGLWFDAEGVNADRIVTGASTRDCV